MHLFRLFFVISFILFQSCEYHHRMQFTVANNTNENMELFLRFKSDNTFVDTLKIDEEVVINLIDGVGARTEDIMDGIDKICIDSFYVISFSGRKNINDLKIFEDWQLIYPNEEHFEGIVLRSITEEDLE